MSEQIKSLLQSCQSLANEKKGVAASHEWILTFALTLAALALGIVGAAKL